MSSELTPSEEVAALWGLAENTALDLSVRLACAIEALGKMSALVPGWDA